MNLYLLRTCTSSKPAKPHAAAPPSVRRGSFLIHILCQTPVSLPRQLHNEYLPRWAFGSQSSHYASNPIQPRSVMAHAAASHTLRYPSSEPHRQPSPRAPVGTAAPSRGRRAWRSGRLVLRRRRRPAARGRAVTGTAVMVEPGTVSCGRAPGPRRTFLAYGLCLLPLYTFPPFMHLDPTNPPPPRYPPALHWFTAQHSALSPFAHLDSVHPPTSAPAPDHA